MFTLQKRNLRQLRGATKFLRIFKYSQSRVLLSTTTKLFVVKQVVFFRRSLACNRTCFRKQSSKNHFVSCPSRLIFHLPEFQDRAASWKAARENCQFHSRTRDSYPGSKKEYLPTVARYLGHIYIIIKHCNTRLMHTFSYSKPELRSPRSLLSSPRYSIYAPLFLLRSSFSRAWKKYPLLPMWN